MSQTKTASPPSTKQREVLDALLRDRAAVVTETTKDGKTRKTVSVVTAKGKPVEGVKLDRAAVESAYKKGWLQEVSSAGAEIDGVFTKNTSYAITLEGKTARKAK